jgi:hypothetical protein
VFWVVRDREKTAQRLRALQNGGEGMCAIGGLGSWGYHTARRDFPSGVTENGNRIGLEGKIIFEDSLLF